MAEFSFWKTFREELGKATAKVAEYAPVSQIAKGLGIGIAGQQATKWQDEATKRQVELENVLVQQIREASAQGDKEKLSRLNKIAQQTGTAGIISSAIADAPTTKQIIASGIEGALMAATGLKLPLAGTSGSLLMGTQARAITSAAARTAATELKGAGLATKALEKVIKPVAREAVIGAGLLGASEVARNKDAQVSDIINAAEKGAYIGGGVTAAGIGIGAAIGAATKAAAPIVSKVSEKVTSGLERFASPTTKIALPGSQVEKTLSYMGEAPKTITQKIAQKLLDIPEKLSTAKARFIDRFSPLDRIEQRIADLKGAPLNENEKIYRDARLLQSVANSDAERKVADFVQNMKPYKDVERESKAYLMQLDFIDRAKLGMKVPGNQTLDGLISGLEKMTDEIGPEKMQKVAEVRRIMQSHNYNLLQERIDAGLITPELRDKLLQTHPNYIPHNVIMDLEERASSGLGGSLNVAKTDLAKAVGSVRNIDDPFTAIIQRTAIATRTIEKNKLLTNLVKAQEEFNVIPEMKPLVTAKQVEQRIAHFEELRLLKSELQDIKKDLRKNKKLDISLTKRIESLNQTIQKEEEALFNNVRALRGENDELASYFEKAKQERDRVEMTLEGLVFSDVEKEIGYGRFKEIANRRPRVLDSDIDESALKKMFPDRNIDNELFSGADDVTNDELLEQFKSRFLQEKSLPRPEKGFIRSAQAIEKRVSEKGERVVKTEQQIQEKVLQRKDAVSMIDSISKNISAIQDRRKELFVDLQGLRNRMKQTGEETINLFRNGIKETWVVPQDVAYAIKNFDTPITPEWFKWLTKPQEILKKFATQYNLSFTIPNKFRDKQTAAITANAFIEAMAKKTGVMPQAVNLSTDEIRALYKSSGGFGASIFDEGENVIFKKLSKIGITGKVQYANPAKLIDFFNKRIEESTRLDVFRKALERGLSPKDAAFVSRDATIDFAKMGTWMRPLNRAIPFLNARVQGFINLPRAIAESPEGFARMQLYTSVYPTMLLYQHNRRFESYKNISQYFKNKYWVVMVNETESVDPYNGNLIMVPQFITLPKGEGQALVSGPIQYYLEKADKIDYRKTSEMIADTLGSASPLEFQSFDSKNLSASIISQFGPLANILVGQATNIDPYYGTAIIPESRLKAPKPLQFSRANSEVAKYLGKVLNVSPARIDFYINAFGGLPQDVRNVIGLAMGGSPKKESLSQTPFGAATRVPISRRFLRESGERGLEKEFRIKQKEQIEQDVTGQRLEVSDRANEIFIEMNRRKTKEERLNYLNSLGDELTPEIRKKIKALKNYRQAVEVLDKNDPVEVRARYILQRIDEMKRDGIKQEDRVKFLSNIEKSGILTKDVKKRMRQLKTELNQ